MRKLLALLTVRWSIKGRIASAFLAMGVVSVLLGMLAVVGATRAGDLVTRTYDETMVANSYIRAAAGDFASMQSAFARSRLMSEGDPTRTLMLLSSLHDSFQADLSTAIEKSRVAQIVELAASLRASEEAWREATRHLGAKPTVAQWKDLAAKATDVESRAEDMVERVASQGYAFRADAQTLVRYNTRLALAGVIGSLVISGIVALMLYLRISAPIGTAALFAREIAAGRLDGKPPKANPDEIGDLITAMVAMRTDIAAMMDEQIVLRESSQARIAEALEGSADGVVVVDAAGVIQLANGPALDCLGLPRNAPVQGAPVSDVLAVLERADGMDPTLLRMRGTDPETEEVLRPNGRWIRNSRHRTSEGGLVALYTDITAMRDQRDRLADANVTLDAALGHMSQGLCLFDGDNRLKLANTRLRAMFGLSERDVAPGTAYVTILSQVLSQGGGVTAEDVKLVMRLETTMLARRHVFSRAVTLGNRTIAITQQAMPEGGWMGTYEDITERRRAESQIAFLANHDALTHLPNRTMLATRVDEALTRARRGTGFAILCLDLDHFKQVNDTLGHAVGDQLLVAVADRILSCVREVDTVARLGGDEFAVLQTDVQQPEQVSILAQRIVDVVGAPYAIEGHDIQIAASIGIALSPNDGLSHGLLLKSADAALYKAKEEGRRTFRFFEAAMDETLQMRHALEADLRHAIANDELDVAFQPLLDVRSGTVRSFEALARWRHPQRGYVPPDQFIPIAEETGLIKEIGAWMLRTACHEAARWPEGLSVAVNVSTIQLRDPAFLDTVANVLEQSGLPPSRLELEITESVFMANTTKIMPLLTRLRAIGVRFAMDDFGTGYSSLSTLRAFPFDKIKIDRSFVRDMSAADAAAQIIRTILALGRSLGMRVTAEGVESRAQQAFLEAEGCDELQGYLISRPMPRTDVLPWLAEESRGARGDLAA